MLEPDVWKFMVVTLIRLIVSQVLYVVIDTFLFPLFASYYFILYYAVRFHF